LEGRTHKVGPKFCPTLILLYRFQPKRWATTGKF
jgi:hypothetical protein